MRLPKRERASLNSPFARAQKVTRPAFHFRCEPCESTGPDDAGAVYRVSRSETRGEHDAMGFIVRVYAEWRTSTRKARFVLAVHEILHALVAPLADLIPDQLEKLEEQREETLVYQLQRALVGDVD